MKLIQFKKKLNLYKVEKSVNQNFIFSFFKVKSKNEIIQEIFLCTIFAKFTNNVQNNSSSQYNIYQLLIFVTS